MQMHLMQLIKTKFKYSYNLKQQEELYKPRINLTKVNKNKKNIKREIKGD
jgi:hypothetical protein